MPILSPDRADGFVAGASVIVKVEVVVEQEDVTEDSEEEEVEAGGYAEGVTAVEVDPILSVSQLLQSVSCCC